MKNNNKKSEGVNIDTEIPLTKDHVHTFRCLKQCAEWYVVAISGSSTVRIPCKKLAVQFTDNKDEKPILEKDIFDVLIQ